jgi:hypothetical protein
MPGFIFGWRAFSSVSLCKSIKCIGQLYALHEAVQPAGQPALSRWAAYMQGLQAPAVLAMVCWHACHD